MRWTGTSASADATERLGRALGRALEPLPRGGAVVALLGDLGAGKTVFTGGLAHGLGLPEDVPVTSPTFTVAKAYRTRVRLDHLDAYHLHGRAELEAAGFEELGGEGRVLCVEWADRVADALPPDRLEVTITPVPPRDRDAPGAGAPASAPAEPPRTVEVVATGRRSEAALERARAGLDAAVARATGTTR